VEKTKNTTVENTENTKNATNIYQNNPKQQPGGDCASIENCMDFTLEAGGPTASKRRKSRVAGKYLLGVF